MSPYICEKTTSTQVLTSKLAAFWVDKDTPKNTLHHLLKSNLAPSHFEIITIRALITVAEDRIEELHRIPIRTCGSHAAESRLLKFIEEHKGLLSPVRRYLPSEIIQEIFLHYAGCYPEPFNFKVYVPWKLGHISHRWREIALNLPSLWDDIPGIEYCKRDMRSIIPAFTCLIERTRTSPTLKFRINEFFKGPFVNLIISHSERIEKLDILVTDSFMLEFERLKGRLPNLRDLRLTWNKPYLHARLSLKIFDTLPALRRVTLRGPYSSNDGTELCLPWSQITHFEEHSRLAWKYLPPLSCLHSLTSLYIDQSSSNAYPEFEPRSLHEPTTLPNLLILTIIPRCHKENTFIEYLTVPAIEFIKISGVESLVPRLAAMLSRSHGAPQLQRLAFRAGPLRPGELSTLLELTPRLIELDIPIPPEEDIERLTCCNGEAMLVPMLQALYLEQSGPVEYIQQYFLNSFARNRCELNGIDSEGAAIQNSLDTLCVKFGSCFCEESRGVLNSWAPVFNPQDVEAVKLLMLRYRGLSLYSGDNKDIHYYLRRLVDFSSSVQRKNKDNLEQRVIDILDGWDRLLLNNLGDCGYWTRALPHCNDSLVYITKEKCRALRMSPDYLSIVYGLKIEGPHKIPLWMRI